jgi:hypothetical protein
VVVKQNQARFYRMSMFVLSDFLVTVPLAVLDVAIFGSAAYWIAGLVDDGGRFVFFLLTLLVVSYVRAKTVPLNTCGDVRRVLYNLPPSCLASCVSCSVSHVPLCADWAWERSSASLLTSSHHWYVPIPGSSGQTHPHPQL